MKKIGVIDNHDSFVYNLVQLLNETKSVSVDVFKNDILSPEIATCYDALLISPGPGLPEDAGELMPFLKQIYQHIPILGVCLGHQAIAQLFGLKLSHLGKPLHGHITTLNQIDTQDIIFKDLPLPIRVGRYHSWVVNRSEIENNPDLTLSSTDEEGHVMSFYHKQYPIHGVQFHPESYMTANGDLMIRNWFTSL
ncbi:MAG: aminodeoxychorismate/anthranilate synthase component II [Bacteroidaceae bacterium]|nr:aminodeoxychorismate/anthranilate synthase component II [Bacteroidaceae bacterium]